jgi:hypothetical protein
LIVIKRWFIVAFLWLAYSFLLAHAIIPHHHHSRKVQHDHLSGHHHNSDDSEQENDQDSPSPLEYYGHSGPVTEFQNPVGKIDCSLHTSQFLVSLFEIHFDKEDESPPDTFIDQEFRIKSRFIFSSKGLRAPPVA